ncbi:MAG: hypothetical protein ACK44A_13170 [Roseateles sp.]
MPSRPQRPLAYRSRADAARTVYGRALEDFLPLLPAEQILLRACRLGEVAKLGDAVPEVADDNCRVRAAFLRFLLLGGDTRAPVHEQGVRLMGACVDGLLHLGGCRILRSVDLKRCRFTRLLFAQDARIEGLLTLQGSLLARGLNADRLHCAGLHLRHGFKAEGEVRLLGARIDGVLDCQDGRFEAKAGRAFSADRVVVQGSAFFGGEFGAIGKVRLEGAQIGGMLSCRGGQFEAKEGYALSTDNATDAALGSSTRRSGPCA